ncbi:MAG TPA: hypothetical protein VJT31_10535 [Rugosimonospora sp.]|nr:hypothetical protein [Rugosimonospora sp.]
MPGDAALMPDWHVLSDEQVRRWEEVLDNLARMLPGGAAGVVVDAHHSRLTDGEERSDDARGQARVIPPVSSAVTAGLPIGNRGQRGRLP